MPWLADGLKCERGKINVAFILIYKYRFLVYNLQREAPKPFPVPCTQQLSQVPEQYSIAYHGPISRQSTEEILNGQPSGAYLIRDSQRADDAFTLAIRYACIYFIVNDADLMTSLKITNSSTMLQQNYTSLARGSLTRLISLSLMGLFTFILKLAVPISCRSSLRPIITNPLRTIR